MTLYGEGSNASSTSKANDLSQSSGERRKLRHSEGSGMLIGDPLGEGSNASSTDSEHWRVGERIPQNERELRRSGVGPKAQTGAWPAQIWERSCVRNPTLRDFRKNAEHSMCELTAGWILEKCPKSSTCTHHNMDFRKNAEHLMCDLTIYIFWECSMALERRTTHSLEWEGTQTLRRERHAHRWPSMVRGAMLARPARRMTYHRALGSGETQTLRRERHAHRWPSRWGEQC